MIRQTGLLIFWALVWSLGILPTQTRANPSHAAAADVHRLYLADLLTRHPGVLSAKSQLSSAQHDTEAAKWQFLPTPSIGYEKNAQASGNLTDSRTLFARLQQPLWTGGRLTAQLDKARAQEVMASLALDEQRLVLATRWLQLWAEVQAAALKSQAFQTSEAQHLLYVRQVQSRAQEGHAPLSDVQLSLSRLAGVQAELEQAKSQKQQAIGRLQQMYGAPMPLQPLHWTAALQTPWRPAESSRSQAQWLTMALDSHPSIQRSMVAVHVLRADADIAKSRASPEVYLRGEWIHRDVSKSMQQMYVGVTSNWGAGLSSLAAVASAQARLEAQAQDIEVRRRDIADQIHADLQTIESQTQRLIYLVQARESAEQFMRASERQFDAGRRTWQELMNTAREQAQVLVQLADSQATRWLAQQRLTLLATGLDAYLHNTGQP